MAARSRKLDTYVAVEPPNHPASAVILSPSASASVDPPSFRDSQYDIVLRRQRLRTKTTKSTSIPSRFFNNEFLFAGWGTVTNLLVSEDALSHSRSAINDHHSRQNLGQWTGSAFAGNAVLGSIFYSLPPVVAAAGVYSPISLFLATLTFFFWRPIMVELASALPIQGAPYSYLINVSSKSLALAGAALLLLDFASTAAVSAATASSYLNGEVRVPFPVWVGTLIIVVLFALAALCGVKESAKIALAQLTFHAVTMIVLIGFAANQWRVNGNFVLKSNWHHWRSQPFGPVARQIFNGYCLSFLTLTGFETTPSYVARLRPGSYPRVLRNLHWPVIGMDAIIMLFVLALVPLSDVLSGSNVLSRLAEQAAGKWLRFWLVADAVCVLCGGVLTGIISACELFEQLAHDRVVPSFFFRSLPLTGSPYLSIGFFSGFTMLLYATSRADLNVVSKMFAVVWLSVMSLFPVALIALNYNRDRLERELHTPLFVSFITLGIVVAVFVGNIAYDPSLLEYFAIYFIVVWLIFAFIQNKTNIIQSFYWILDQSGVLSKSKTLGLWLVRMINQSKKQPVAVLAKTDEINYLMRLILYVERNEDTACIKLVHFVDAEKGVPSELEANSKILDEAFPEITIDLILVPAPFDPVNVRAISNMLDIPVSLIFMTCPGKDFPHKIRDFGTRIISM
ncbi:amino acid permease-domain-containing protein [Flagelloscypha sp. PMI_526]|nr:amino acid permease-domain-containing protein [Flagelloscypha sp. PMI_526]